MLARNFCVGQKMAGMLTYTDVAVGNALESSEFMIRMIVKVLRVPKILRMVQ